MSDKKSDEVSSKSKELGKKGFNNLSDSELEYVTTMDGGEYGEYKRERMKTSGAGHFLERFEKMEKELKKKKS